MGMSSTITMLLLALQTPPRRAWPCTRISSSEKGSNASARINPVTATVISAGLLPYFSRRWSKVSFAAA
uniref:Putative secreted protein n=1 Tax=Ixodes ricinus TaxID=34613 RepID=A0A6B0TTC0_IXORI